MKRCDSRLSSVMGAAGELFAVRRSLYQPPPPDTLLDDFVISLRLVERGWRFVYEPRAVAVEEPSPGLHGDWQRRTRNAAGGFQAMARLTGLLKPARGRVAWQYVSHRVLRWAVTPFLLPLLFVLNTALVARPTYRLLLAGQTLFYAIALLGYALQRLGIRFRLAHALFYFVFTNAAAIVGFWRFATGSQPVTWVKAR
jgi:cellulose synthase/poly-beta-1,6-N-acetylglucosamine synthase-like glycosyltransferase